MVRFPYILISLPHDFFAYRGYTHKTILQRAKVFCSDKSEERFIQEETVSYQRILHIGGQKFGDNLAKLAIMLISFLIFRSNLVYKIRCMAYSVIPHFIFIHSIPVFIYNLYSYPLLLFQHVIELQQLNISSISTLLTIFFLSSILFVPLSPALFLRYGTQ